MLLRNNEMFLFEIVFFIPNDRVKIDKAFSEIDVDGNGMISAEELSERASEILSERFGGTFEMGKNGKFPHKFGETSQQSRPAQAVAPAKRSAKSGRKSVRLTPSQVAIANKLGVPLEEYAKYVE